MIDEYSYRALSFPRRGTILRNIPAFLRVIHSRLKIGIYCFFLDYIREIFYYFFFYLKEMTPVNVFQYS